MRVRRSGATDILVLRAFQEATEEIDRAINKTLSSLFSTDGSSGRVNPYRLGRFPDATGRAAARPAELFERTLINIRRMVNAGVKANVSNEFRYEEILTAEQVKLQASARYGDVPIHPIGIHACTFCKFSLFRWEKSSDYPGAPDTGTDETAATCASTTNTAA